MRKIVLKVIGALAAIVIARSGHAALVESEWGPSIGVPGSELVYHDGGIHFTVDHSSGGVDMFDYATRDWEGGYLTLGEDWTLRVGIHLDDASQFVNSYSTIGVEAVQLNWAMEYPPPRLVGTSAGSWDMQRIAFPLYGFSVDAAIDTVLVQTYSVSDQSFRTYIRLPGGPLEQFSTINVSTYFLPGGIDPDEPLKVRIFAGSRSPSTSFGLGIGNVYIDSFGVEPGVSVPEPNSASVLAALLVCATAHNAIGRRACHRICNK